MNQLAQEIQNNLEALVEQYDAYLQTIPAYAAMAAEERQDIARNAFQLFVTGLEEGDPGLFPASVRGIAQERAAQGIEIESLQQAVGALIDVVEPLLTSIEAANFAWRTLHQTQRLLSNLAMEQSRAAQDRFRRMAETSRDGVTIIEDGQVVYVNDRLCEILGYPRDEIVRMSGFDFAAPEEKERLHRIIQEVRQKRQPLEEIGFWAVRSDGSRRYIRNRYSVIREGDEITGRLVFTTDLTERRRAEEALRESEALFRSVVENAQTGIFIVDDAFRLVYTNEVLLRIVGYSREEVLGENFQKFLDEESKALVADRYVRRQRGEDVASRYEFDIIRKDGEKRRVEISSTAIRDAEGNVRTLAQLLDVTERRRAESEKEAALEELLEQQAFLRQIIDLNPNLIFVKDRESRFVLANRALAEVYGTTVDDVIGKSDADFTDPEQARQFHLDDLSVMNSLEERVIPDRRLTDAEGNLRWVQAIKRPLVDEDGIARHVLGVSMDITARKQLEEQIRELLERRGQQVRTSTEIAQEIAAARALPELLERVVTLIKERFDYYHAQIFRYEPAVDAVVLVTSYGEAGQALLEEGHQLTMGRGVVGTAAASGQPVLATDVRQDPDWVPNPHLPETRGELAVPIKWRDEVLGILDVQSDRAGALTEEDQILLEGLCGQIAIAIESTRLQQEMEENLRELERLYGAISREGWLGFQAEERAAGYRFDRRDVFRQDDLWLPEIDEAVEQRRLVSGGSDEAAAVVAPLVMRGQAFGALGVEDDPDHPLSADDLALIESLSEQVAQALESARLFDQTQAALAESQALYEATRTITGVLDLEALAERLAEVACQLTNASYSVVLTLDPETGEPEQFAPYGLASEWQPPEARLPEGRGVLGAILQGETVRSDNVHHHPGAVGAPAWHFPVRAVLGVPLVYRGETQGLMLVGDPSEEHSFSETDEQILDAFAAQAAIAIENQRLFEQTQAALADTETLYRAGATLNAAQTYDDVLALLCEHTVLGQFMNVSLLWFERPWTKDRRPERGDVLARRRDAPADVGLAHYPLGLYATFLEPLQLGEPLYIQDVATDPRLSDEVRAVFDGSLNPDLKAQSLLFVPLEVRGVWPGLITGAHQAPVRLRPGDDRRLTALANQAAIVVQNLQQLGEARARAEREHLARTITDRVRRGVDREAIMRIAARELSEMLDASKAVVRLGTREQLLGDDVDAIQTRNEGG